MSLLFEAIASMSEHGDIPAIVQLDHKGESARTVSYDGLYRSAKAVAHAIGQYVERGATIGLVAANSVSWIEADLALLMGRYIEVPVPLGFSGDQAAHLLASCQLILVDDAGRRQLDKWRWTAVGAFPAIPLLDIETAARSSDDTIGKAAHDASDMTVWDGEDDWVCKVIHTSGTTSKPKGVKIRARALDTVLTSLRELTEAGDYARYLNLVPFSLLLEQFTALYLPYLQQGHVLLAPPDNALLGESGASVEDKVRLMAAAAPTAMTLTPSMVEAIHAAAQAVLKAQPQADARTLSRALFGRDTPPLLAAGGAPVSKDTLSALAELGIGVYVGYGLSENSSVACWNTRSANRIGTVGKPLPHVQCKLSADGELGIRSWAAFAGYTGSDPSACALDSDGWLWTGDIAAIDDDGFVSVVGRKKNLIITSHGRNVSPEFVEASYRQVNGVKEIVILGDQRESLSAFVLATKGCDTQDLASRLTAFGQARLSDVERVTELICLPESEELLSTLFTVTGRPKREHIERYVQTLRGQPSLQ